MEDADTLFEQVRRDTDPLRQAKIAGELIIVYQQRSVELARLRKEAINRAVSEKNMTYSAVAAQLGLTRGRITQIKQKAPPAERAFFGVGPITVAVPLRDVAGRHLPVISSEDARARDILTDVLTDLAFQVERYDIPTNGLWVPPHHDVIAICGPKSSPVTAQAIASDPFLTFEPDQKGRWTIRERDGSRVYESPLDDATQGGSDIAYFGRLALGDRTLMIVAGVHALGSVGVADYVARNLAELYHDINGHRFSMVIGSRFEGVEILGSAAHCPPRIHE